MNNSDNIIRLLARCCVCNCNVFIEKIAAGSEEYICISCDDPNEVTIFCTNCKRRLILRPDDFANSEYRIRLENSGEEKKCLAKDGGYKGLVIKLINGCSQCHPQTRKGDRIEVIKER